MNVRGFVQNLKNKMRERETMNVESAAKKLKDLKDERVRLEGQKRVYDLKAKEESKLKALKGDVRKRRMESNVLGRVVLGVQKNIKENAKKPNKKVDAPSFIGSGAGMFGEQAKSPFALKKDEKKPMMKPKSKGKVKKVVYYQ